MPEEIEKKFIVSHEKAIQLKKEYPYQPLGIIQWYTDGATNQLKSERIRMILKKDGEKQWVLGRKECINGSLIHRKEVEEELTSSTISYETLSQYPFIIKTRMVFFTPCKAEVVLDCFLKNPYLSYDVDYLLEIELKNGESDIESTTKKVFSYFKLDGLIDVSTDFNYTNHTIALNSKQKNRERASEFQILMNILEKALGSDDFEQQKD